MAIPMVLFGCGGHTPRFADAGEDVSDTGRDVQDASYDASSDVDALTNPFDDPRFIPQPDRPHEISLSDSEWGAKVIPDTAFLRWQDGEIPDGRQIDHYEICSTNNGGEPFLPETSCPSRQLVHDRFALLQGILDGESRNWKVRACYNETGTECSLFSRRHGDIPSYFQALERSAAYGFDGNLFDSSGNGLDGETAPRETPSFVRREDLCNNQPVYGTIGETDQVACFDGEDDVVRLPHDPAFDAPTIIYLHFSLQETDRRQVLIDKTGISPHGESTGYAVIVEGGMLVWMVNGERRVETEIWGAITEYIGLVYRPWMGGSFIYEIYNHGYRRAYDISDFGITPNEEDVLIGAGRQEIGLADHFMGGLYFLDVIQDDTYNYPDRWLFQNSFCANFFLAGGAGSEDCFTD